MIKIYICDDEPFWIEKAHQLTVKHFNNRFEMEINTFNNSNDLINVLLNKKEYCDIVILDIDMPNLNGFDVAKQIKEKYPNILLLFYTSHEQYVFEAFQFQPFRYIRKTYVDTEMELALSAAEYVISNRNTKSILLKTKDENYKIDVNNIVYFETIKRRCDVHLSDGNILNVGISLKELVAEIDSPDFIMIHSGAVVNVSFIKHYSNFDITLEDGNHLIVSRGRLNEVKQSIVKYWRNRI